MTQVEALLEATRKFARAVSAQRFEPPVGYVYNPLDYAFLPHATYLRKYGTGKKRVLFLGMNPGPFGMAQTGVPFGEVNVVRDFLGIEEKVEQPTRTHPKRPIEGFSCARSEVSGRRLWGAIAEHWGSADMFFEDHFVANYCPLVFMEDGGKNRTPDKLVAAERSRLYAVCDDYLRLLVSAMEPEFVIGVGKFAETRAVEALAGQEVKVASVLHPSPASPKANAGWAAQARAQLRALGVEALG